MPIWRIASVSQDPNVSLSSWRILETDEGSKHFVGSNRLDHTGCVSSAVSAFDPFALRGVTRSGRVYQLIGHSGWDRSAQYVWERWCKVNDVMSYVDVTEQLQLAGVQMSTAVERTRAVVETRNFLRILATAGQVTIPGLVQTAANGLLRHYPLDVDLEASSLALPDIWAPPSSAERE
jgi:hypothetical protein